MEFDPKQWATAAEAVKASIGAIGSAFDLVKRFRSSPSQGPDEQLAVEKALGAAETASKVANAQMAKALGYDLCQCQFPPTAMLTVGYRVPRGEERKVVPVNECPVCGYNTAGPLMHTRTAPPRATS